MPQGMPRSKHPELYAKLAAEPKVPKPPKAPKPPLEPRLDHRAPLQLASDAPFDPGPNAAKFGLQDRKNRERLGTVIDGITVYEFPIEGCWSQSWIRQTWGPGQFLVIFMRENRLPCGNRMFDLAPLDEAIPPFTRLPMQAPEPREREPVLGASIQESLTLMKAIKDMSREETTTTLGGMKDIAQLFLGFAQKQSSREEPQRDPEMVQAINTLHAEIQALKTGKHLAQGDDSEGEQDEGEDGDEDWEIPTSFQEALQMMKPIVKPYIPQLVNALSKSGQDLVQWFTKHDREPIPQSVLTAGGVAPPQAPPPVPTRGLHDQVPVTGYPPVASKYPASTPKEEVPS